MRAFVLPGALLPNLSRKPSESPENICGKDHFADRESNGCVGRLLLYILGPSTLEAQVLQTKTKRLRYIAIGNLLFYSLTLNAKKTYNSENDLVKLVQITFV